MAFTADEAFQHLQAAHAHDRLAHAYLITGPAGSGKRELASRLAGLILGDSSPAPLQNLDAHCVEPESKSRRILIEQMRELEHALQMRSSFGRQKVAVIFEADRLQPQASNAFLKTLEEPPGNSHLLLVTALPDQLLPTILSRCIEVALRRTSMPPLNALQERLLQRLASFAAKGRADFAAAFMVARDFQECLGTARQEARAGVEAQFKQEEQRYKQTSEAGQYLDQREDYFDALGEARYQQERSGLLETLITWWGDVLRQQHHAPALDLPAYADATAELAARCTTAQLLRKAAALEQLRDHLGRSGVNEQLAIECAFLKAFGE